MKTIDSNRLNMVVSTLTVIEKYNATWKDHVAFSEGVDALNETRDSIVYQRQIAEGNPGAASLKEQALGTLGRSAAEIIGATLAYAKKNALPELAARVNYSATDVISGKAAQVVTRCTTIHTAANEVVAELGKYGITAAKLAAFKKKIDAFDEVKTAPRQSRVESSAANGLLSQLVGEAGRVLRDELDGLMIQFQESAPNFYEEYFSARTIVDTGASHSEPAKPAVPAPTPAPVG